MDVYTLETLDVYNEAETFSDKIWGIVETWSWYKKETIGKQLTRAADSISAKHCRRLRTIFLQREQAILFLCTWLCPRNKSLAF
uniref:four helix bundle protein n=1 Tax=Flavisolibacter ginsenosidimutans TaxID=661481 RepID=UPI0037429265